MHFGWSSQAAGVPLQLGKHALSGQLFPCNPKHRVTLQDALSVNKAVLNDSAVPYSGSAVRNRADLAREQ